MDAYNPASPFDVFLVLTTLALTLTLGFGLTRLPLWPARIASWTLVLGGFFGMHLALLDSPAGFRMLAIIGVVLFAMKSVVAVEDQARSQRPPLPPCLLYTSPSPRDATLSRMPSSA